MPTEPDELRRREEENLRLRAEELSHPIVVSAQCAALTVEGHDDCPGVFLDVEEECACACHIPWVWRSRLDRRFACRVVRVSDYQGRLIVSDMVENKVLLDHEVGLSYGARFGPDISDLAHWQDECLVAADRYMAPPPAD